MKFVDFGVLPSQAIALWIGPLYIITFHNHCARILTQPSIRLLLKNPLSIQKGAK